jgi:uncharacterized membrane protein YphA (DoxX/SURF4 family)/peroxiredoxin
MATAVLAVRVVIAAVFATAGVGKLLDLEGSRRAMRDFGVRGRAADLAGLLLPLAELAVATALALRPTAQWGGVAALVLLLGFIAGIGNALRHGFAPDCHCFGQIHSAPAGPSTLARNGALAALAVFVVVEGPGPAIDTWVGARSAAELVAVGVGLSAAVLAMFSLQLWTEVRQLRNEIGTARRMAAGAPPGLPVGAAAPTFALQTVEGETVTLDSLCERGQPALLVFASLGCGSCLELFPNIRRWQQTLAERLTIALVSSGSAKDNRPLLDEYGLHTVLLQENSELVEAYRIRGTPSAVLVTADGKIGSIPAESAFGIEPMVRLVLRGIDSAPVPEGSIA